MHSTLADSTLERFTPDPGTWYTLDAAAHLARVPRHLILVCCKHGLISPWVDPDYGGYYFHHEHLRLLQRIGALHVDCGVNLTGIKIILGLIDEVDRLKSALAAHH
jgi:DNA-binding transcriptional MerR regulator